jgi:BirA family transcriptional regulator, biotin operon repressor / biotin---[acetyl-CoA-carboxylase] ligase
MASAAQTGALAEALYTALQGVWPGVVVDVLPEVDSTNTQLLQRPRFNDASPALMLALTQTAGRGRLGRSWQGEPRASLMLSMARALAPADWSGLSLAVGVAAAQALHPDIRLKWPNDLWLSSGATGRKLGGILIETASLAHTLAEPAAHPVAHPAAHPAAHPDASAARWCVVGIGINLQPRPAQGLSTAPAWLGELMPEADVGTAALAVAPAIARALLKFERMGFAPFRAEFGERDALKGAAVSLSDGQTGIAQGVDETGAMLVHTGQQLRRVASDELSVRPQPSSV